MQQCLIYTHKTSNPICSSSGAYPSANQLTFYYTTSLKVGKLTFHIFCALAEFEREIIRQRTVEGLKAARARKKALGRPKGLTKSAQQKAYTASALYREGTLTTREICEQLNISVPTLYNYLKYQNITLKASALAYEVVNTVS